MKRRLKIGLVCAAVLLLAACSSDAAEEPQLIAAAVPTAVPTSVPTTAPIALPTATPAPSPTPIPAATATPVPVPTATAEPTATPEPQTDATENVAEQVAATPEAVETATPVPPTPVPPTATPITPEATAEPQVEPTATPVAETPTAVPTAVVATGEPPLECYDREAKVYRGFVDGVDVLSFEGGRVFCSGAGTNGVSAVGSYRHSTGLVVSRNGDFILNSAGNGYIPYSGSIHFCTAGLPASVPIVADTVPALLVVIDNEAQRQVSLGATAPTGFNGTAQC